MVLSKVLAEPPAPPISPEQVRKEAAVGYWRARDVDAALVAKAFGIHLATLYRWGDEIGPKPEPRA